MSIDRGTVARRRRSSWKVQECRWPGKCGLNRNVNEDSVCPISQNVTTGPKRRQLNEDSRFIGCTKRLQKHSEKEEVSHEQQRMYVDTIIITFMYY